MINALGALSDSIAKVVAKAAPLLCAIRIGPNRHVTGLVQDGGVIVTVDQALPVADGYTVVLADRSLASVRPGLRDPASNLAVVHLDTPIACGLSAWAVAAPGNVAIVLGTDADASPTVRLAVVHRMTHTADGPAPVLDLPQTALGPGDLVVDPNGHLIGLAALGPNNEAMVIPSSVLVRFITPETRGVPRDRRAVPSRVTLSGRRGWLGVALQPISIPDHLIARAAQPSGRMVISVTPGGPAERAGLRANDILLALDDTNTTGANALRAFLEADRIGSKVEVKVMRDGNVVTAHLVVGAQPG
jgi:S1-C subfamily serine protease